MKPATVVIVPGLFVAMLCAEAVSPAATPKADVLAGYTPSPAFDANAAWHRQVGQHEIRMSYFSRGDPKVAMRCVANLSSYRVTTFREVHNHATQSTKTRPLSHSQVLTLRGLKDRLTEPDVRPSLQHLLIVSMMLGKERRVLIFDKTSPPQGIIRLYDLTGAYLPAAADDDTPKPMPNNEDPDAAESRKLATQFLAAAGYYHKHSEQAFVGLSPGLHKGPHHGFARVDIHEPSRIVTTEHAKPIPFSGERKRSYYVSWNAETKRLGIDALPIRRPSAGYGKHSLPDGWMPIFRSTTVRWFRWQQAPDSGDVTVQPTTKDGEPRAAGRDENYRQSPQRREE